MNDVVIMRYGTRGSVWFSHANLQMWGLLLLNWHDSQISAGDEVVIPIEITGDAIAFPERDPSFGMRYPQRVFPGTYTLKVAQSALDPHAASATLTL